MEKSNASFAYQKIQQFTKHLKMQKYVGNGTKRLILIEK